MMERLYLILPLFLGLCSCVARYDMSSLESLSREQLFMNKSDSLPEEVDAFIEDYADTFISILPKERQERRETLFAAIRESGMSRWGCCLALEEFGTYSLS